MRRIRTWHYLPSGKRNHVVDDDQFRGHQFQKAICGVQVMAALPPMARWQSDPEGLDRREQCQICLGVLEREKSFV